MDSIYLPPLTAALPAAETARSDVAAERDAAMRKAAVAFESVFLTEMLTIAGLGKVPEAFGGGVGEQGFSDFLTREYAIQIAESRSIGLADSIYRSLKERV